MEQEISFNDLLKLHESGFRFISGNSVMTPTPDAAIAFTKYVDFEGHVHVAVWRGATCVGGAELPTDKKGRLARPVPGAQMPIREKKNITAGEAFELLGLTTVEDFEQFLAKCQE